MFGANSYNGLECARERKEGERVHVRVRVYVRERKKGE